MIRTCMNCKYFTHTLEDPSDPSRHIHYYCTQWCKEIDGFLLVDRVEHECPYYDDLETGHAFCYLFEPAEKPFQPDEWFESNRLENIRKQIN